MPRGGGGGWCGLKLVVPIALVAGCAPAPMMIDDARAPANQCRGQSGATLTCPPLELAAGELVRFRLDPMAPPMDLIIRRAGETLFVTHSLDLVAEGLALIAETSALYWLELRSSGTPLDDPAIVVPERRTAQAHDRTRVAAERAYAEAARITREEGSAADAERLFKEAEELWRKLGDLPGQARASTGIGVSELQLSGCRKAATTHDRALDLLVLAATPAPRLELTVRRDAAKTWLDCDRPQEAVRELRRSRALARALGDPVLEAGTITLLSSGYRLIGRREEAEALEAEALGLLRAWAQAHPEEPRHEDQADALFDIAANYHARKDKHHAARLFQEALQRYRLAGKHRGEVRALNRLSSIFSERYPERALEYNAIAWGLHGEHGSERTRAYILHNRGHGLRVSGDLAAAEEAYRQALKIRRDIGYRDGEVYSLATLSGIRENRGFHEDAVELASMAVDIVEEMASRLPDSEHRPSYFTTGRDFFDGYVQRLLTLHEDHPRSGYLIRAFDATERTRARGLLDAVARTPRQALKLEEIRHRILDPDTLLLQYWISYNKESALFLVSREGVRVFDLPRGQEIDELARRVHDLVTARKRQPFEPEDDHHRRIADADAALPEAERRLSRMILGPVARHLGRKRLLIAADGWLQAISFAALPDPNHPRRRLIEDHEVRYLPSASVLAALRERRDRRAPAPRTMMVFADPVFDRDDDRLTGVVAQAAPPRPATAGGRSGGALSRLHDTIHEAATARRLLPADQIRIVEGFDATRLLALSPEVASYRILHFATHSVADGGEDAPPGIMLSAFTPEGREQDGLVRRNEIAQLELATDLVVLSSCSTSRGVEWWGEGALSVARAFLQAGASGVVTSLWDVDDKKTSKLMSRFLERLLATPSPGAAAALREAQLATMADADTSDPYFWAAFGLQGEPASDGKR